MAVVLFASGTTGQTSGGAESIISAPNSVGEFQLHLDLNLMAAGDVIELRVYKMVKASGTSRVAYYTTFAGAQATDAQIAISEWIANTLTDSNAVQFGIKQTFGTTRALPYAVLNRLDFTTTPATADVTKWNGTAVSAPATAGIPEVNVKNVNNVSASAVTTIKAVLGLAVDGVVTTVTNQLTAAQIATGIWQDATAGDFTAANSIGKSIMNGVALGLGLKIAECVLVDTTTTNTDMITQANVRSAVGLASANLDTQLSGINSKTTNLPADPASEATVESKILAAWTTALTESYAADTVAFTPAQALFMIYSLLQNFAIASTTVTMKKLDKSTTSMTATLDDATTPTSRTRAT